VKNMGTTSPLSGIATFTTRPTTADLRPPLLLKRQFVRALVSVEPLLRLRVSNAGRSYRDATYRTYEVAAMVSATSRFWINVMRLDNVATNFLPLHVTACRREV
jgi:hypothetical protein